MKIILISIICLLSLSCKESGDNNESTISTLPEGWESIEVHCINLYKHPSNDKGLVIKSRDQFEEVYNSLPNFNSNCSLDILPEIDFQKYSLIGFAVTSGGCEEPDISISVTQNIGITIDAYIRQKGICKVMFIKNYWWRVPRIDFSTTVQLLKNQE